MGGSYQHVVSSSERTLGQLLDPRDLDETLENPGDVWEAVHEMFGMIWFLAGHLNPDNPASAVKLAKRNYRSGIEISPGVMDDIEPDDELDQ
jgi:phosphoribosylanthranilate isomerase